VEKKFVFSWALEDLGVLIEGLDHGWKGGETGGPTKPTCDGIERIPQDIDRVLGFSREKRNLG